MKTEENVYENANGTEHAAGAEDEKKGSAVLGKFKDVNALLEAYGALEAEFTRRSQRLKALEKEVENSRKERGVCSESADNEAEKPVKGAKESIREPLQVAETTERGEESKIAEVGAGTKAAEVADAAPQIPEPASKPDFVGSKVPEIASGAVEGETEEEKGGTVTEEELFRAANGNESVRLKIIGEYLSSLSKPNAPLVRGGTGALVLSPAKAKTVEDAGLMALRYFKDGRR